MYNGFAQQCDNAHHVRFIQFTCLATYLVNESTMNAHKLGLNIEQKAITITVFKPIHIDNWFMNFFEVEIE